LEYQLLGVVDKKESVKNGIGTFGIGIETFGIGIEMINLLWTWN